jgi:hypothetical protein
MKEFWLSFLKHALQASGAAAVQKMSDVARQRSDSSPQKHKAIRRPSFADSAEAESRVDEDRIKREHDSAAKKREERRRLDDLQRQQDDQDAEEAARRIVDSASRIARLKLEDQQRQQQLLPPSVDEAPQSPTLPLPAPIASAQRDASCSPARAGPSSPVKKYLRNELRLVCFSS